MQAIKIFFFLKETDPKQYIEKICQQIALTSEFFLSMVRLKDTVAGFSGSSRHPEAVTVLKAKDEPMAEALNWPGDDLTVAGSALYIPPLAQC